MTSESLRAAASHEAGHAVVGVVLGLELVSLDTKVTGRRLGAAEFVPVGFEFAEPEMQDAYAAMTWAGTLAQERAGFGDDGAGFGRTPQSRLCRRAVAVVARHHGAIGLAVILHKDEVPDLQILVVFVDTIGCLLIEIAPIVVDLRTGAARTGVPHSPPVVLFTEAQHTFRRRACLNPQPFRFIVICIDGEPKSF